MNFKSIDEVIDYYGQRLKDKGTLTSSWLMFECMSELNDIDLEDWGLDIIDVAEKVLKYLEKEGL